MPDVKTEAVLPPQRLCSEIQLFDLCDLDSCRHKVERFCTEPLLLGQFEKIAEEELRVPERYISEELDDEDYDGDEYDESNEDEEFAGDDSRGGGEYASDDEF